MVNYATAEAAEPLVTKVSYGHSFTFLRLLCFVFSNVISCHMLIWSCVNDQTILCLLKYQIFTGNVRQTIKNVHHVFREYVLTFVYHSMSKQM